MAVSHVSLPTGQKSYKEMRDFYVAVLAPLGYRVFMEEEGKFLGMAPKYGAPDFWLHCGGTEIDKFDGDVEKRDGKTHVAFQANSVKAVYDWYKIAVKAGGVPNGEPGERPQYVKGYYGAYVIDPLGNNIEVTYLSPLWLKALQAAPFVVTGAVCAALAVGVSKYYN